MGEITIKGFPFSIAIEGDTPTKEEAVKIDKIIEQLGELETLPGVAKVSPERQEFLEEQRESLTVSRFLITAITVTTVIRLANSIY